MKTQKIPKVAMVSFFMVLFLLMLSTGVSFAATASLYDSGSGTTTAPSGTSTFALSNDTYTMDDNNTVLNLNKLRPFKTISIALESITLPSGVTFGQAADTTDGTVDGDVYQIYARVGNSIDNIASAERFPLHNETKYNSSTSPYLIYWTPPPAAFARLEIMSGVSAIYGATLNIIPFDVEHDPTLVVFDTQTTSIGASGVSNSFVAESSGGTGFYIPSGAKWFGFFADGNNVPYSTDGTEPTTPGIYFSDGKEKILDLEETKKLGVGSDGAAALDMTPYSRRPY